MSRYTMLRYIGDTPFANRTWRLYDASRKATNWYLARYDFSDQPPAFCIFVWRGIGERWNIVSGMLDIPRMYLPSLLRRLTLPIYVRQ